MALFDVPGWSVPSAPTSNPSESSKSKKRKRPHKNVDTSGQLQSTLVNMDKLMAKLDGGVDNHESKRAKKSKKDISKTDTIRDQSTDKGLRKGNDRKDSQKPGKGAKDSLQKVKKGKQVADPATSTTSNAITRKAIKPKPSEGASSLTPMQQNMKDSLDGARFRWINETLYKTDSSEAHRMMLEDPRVYDEYHTGFRHQVRSWPTNPVSHYISVLSSYPPKTVIADLGCGDAALARALIPADMVVLSFDLVSDGTFVVEADMCGKLPLPGSSEEKGEPISQGQGQIVDVVVCALSLMGTNWINAIREARRVLKKNGELKIAEVTSRFSNEADFVALLESMGFKLYHKNKENSHFTLFDFKKVDLRADSKGKILTHDSILKPCEYKRR